MSVGYYLMKQRKWTLEEQAKFLQMTGELLERGYPLAEALHSVLHHLPPQHHASVTEGVLSLKQGERFSQLLQKLSFHSDLIGYAFFAEQHGNLAEAFLAGSAMMKKRVHDSARLQKVLAYPLFLIVTTLFLFFFMQKFLLPRFSSLYQSMNAEENIFTLIVSASSFFFPLFLSFLMVILSFFILYYFLRFRSLPPIEQKRRLMKIPFASLFFRLYFTHYFTIQLSYLLGGGLSVNESLSLFEENFQQPFYSELGREMRRELRMGEKFEDIVRQYPFFEKELAMIIHHGEKNGKLDTELSFYSQYCLKRLEDKMEKTMRKIQPLLFIIIGLMIVSMYLSVLMPMFQLLNEL